MRKYRRAAMPSGFFGSRVTPAGLPNRLAAPSAAITNRARISVGSASRSPAGRTVAPATYPSTNRGATASVRSSSRAPALTARSASRWSNPSRGITSPYGGNDVRSGHGSWIVVRRAWVRSPITRSKRGSSVSTPMSWIALTERGVRPSPQTFSRGKAAFSTTVTSMPWRAKW